MAAVAPGATNVDSAIGCRNGLHPLAHLTHSGCNFDAGFVPVGHDRQKLLYIIRRDLSVQNGGKGVRGDFRR